MKKFFAILSIAALAFAACDPNNNTDEPQLPSAAGITPVVTVVENVATFSLPDGTTGLIPIWYTNESGDFAFAGNGNNFTKTFFTNGTFKVRMYVSNANGQSKDYAEADFTINATMEWNGYNYDSEFNLWKAAEAGGFKEGPEDTHTYYNPDPNWGAVTDLAYTLNPYKLSIPKQCYNQWQCQFHLVPNNAITLSAEKEYDFSCLIKLNKSCGVTVKLPQIGDDNVFIINEIVDMVEGVNLFYMKGVKGFDGDVKVVFDFGWCQDNTEVEITRITLKDHANDDGTNAPDKVNPNAPVEGFDFQPNSSANLWKAVYDSNGEKYFVWSPNGNDSNGSEVETTTLSTLTKKDNSYVRVLAEATGGQWENQWFIFPDTGHYIPLDAAKQYVLQVKVSADQATPGFFKMSKCTEVSPKHEGDTIWEFGGFNLTPGEETVITSKVLKDIACDNIMFVMTFGGNPANTTVTIKDICLQEYIN